MVSGDVEVSLAVAASTAYPLFLPALDRQWMFSKGQVETEHRVLLSDGGIYDNLGTEPLFDSGKQCKKDSTDFIMVSDAGAPLGRIAPGWFRPFRLKRVADIMGDQTRALRVRSFVNFLQHRPRDGARVQTRSCCAAAMTSPRIPMDKTRRRRAAQGCAGGEA